jgi:hypothetical protein
MKMTTWTIKTVLQISALIIFLMVSVNFMVENGRSVASGTHTPAEEDLSSTAELKTSVRALYSDRRRTVKVITVCIEECKIKLVQGLC